MPHLRKDPITGRWVIMSAARSGKPTDYVSSQITPATSSLSCPFCAGNEDKTPEAFETAYGEDKKWSVKIVPNKYPAISCSSDEEMPTRSVLFEAGYAEGLHDVVIESRSHDFNFYNAKVHDFDLIFSTVIKRLVNISQIPLMNYSLYFKNFGPEAGASLSHSHSQIITTTFVPIQMLEEMQAANEYHTTHKKCVFCSIIEEEKNIAERVICENENYIAITPYASRSPYQIWIMPKKHHDSIMIEENNYECFSLIVYEIFRRLKSVLGEVSFNYVLHSLTPQLRATYSNSNHWYLDIMPKMSKLAGYELGSGIYINSILPEDACKFLREAKV